MKLKIILMLLGILLLSAKDIYAPLPLLPTCIITGPTITWPSGITGRCPDVGAYKGCCISSTLGSSICGLSIGGKCIADADVNTDYSVGYLIQYNNDVHLNNGLCASATAKMECEYECYNPAYQGVQIRCETKTYTDKFGSIKSAAYCTTPTVPATAKEDGRNLDIVINPFTDQCFSYRASSKLGATCACPAEGCIFAVCKASYECISSTSSCADDPTPFATVAAATCTDGYRNQNELAADQGGPCCTNLVKGTGETDVDCGGAYCNKCANGKICLINNDCLSNICTGGICQAPAPTCSDAAKNGAETDVDCGDGCPGCADGKVCLVDSDCSSNYCNAGICAPSCFDITKNQDETDIDCGGVTCPGCQTGEICIINTDCESGVCTGGICQAPSCSDGIKNHDETFMDCGGLCPACQDCGLNIKSWTDLYSLDKTEIAKGLPIYVLLVGANCEGVTADVEIRNEADDSVVTSKEGAIFESDPDSGAHFALAEVDYSLLEASRSYYYVASVHRVSGDDIINSKDEPNGILTILSECHVADPGTCPGWYLEQDAPLNDPTLDADCDGTADCLDDWLYGNDAVQDEPISYIEEKVERCRGGWDCSSSEWSGCKDVRGEYIATRVVRPCGEYDTPCCSPPAGICAPPPSKKVCMEQEEFPVFSWMNVLLVSMMLASFYFYRPRRI